MEGFERQPGGRICQMCWQTRGRNARMEEGVQDEVRETVMEKQQLFAELGGHRKGSRLQVRMNSGHAKFQANL